MSDSVWLDVLPNMKGFGADLAKKAGPAAKSAGKAAGSGYAKAFKDSAGQSGQDQIKDLEKTAKTAAATMQRLASDVSKARQTQKRSAADLLVAEDRLLAATQKHGAESKQTQAAALRVEAAREKAEQATRNFNRAEDALREGFKASKKATEELEKATGDLSGETKKAPGLWGKFRDALVDTDDAGDKAKKSLDSLKNAAQKAGSVIGTSLKWIGGGILAATTAIAGIGAVAIKGGWERALNIEDARAALGAIGHDATGIDKIMENALASVKGTSFGLGDAATIAATAVAAGIEPGAELERTLKLTANSAALARVGLDEMGSVLNKVWTAGRVGSQELNQVADRGIPIWTSLAEHYGVSGTALRKMVSEGKVDAETFATVLEGTVGDAAIAMGDTTRGSWANMLAALSRGGESFLSGVFPLFKDGLQGITEWIDRIAPFAERAGAAIGTWVTGTVMPALKSFGEWFKAEGIPRLQAFGNWIKIELIPRLQTLAAWVRDTLVPWLQELGAKIIEHVVPAVKSMASWIADTLVPAISSVVDWMIQNKDVVISLGVGILTAVAAVKAFSIIQTMIAGLKAAKAAMLALNLAMRANPIGVIVTAVAALTAGLVYFFTQTETGKKIWEGFTNFLSSAWDSVVSGLQAAWDWIVDIFTSAWDLIKKWVIDPYIAYVKFIWTVLVAVKDGVLVAWDWIVKGLKAGWNFIKKAVIDPLIAAWNFVVTALKVVFVTVATAASLMWDLMKAGWDWAKTNVIDRIVAGWNWVWEKFQPVRDFLADAWQWLQDTFKAGWDWIKTNVVDRFVSGWEWAKDKFDEVKETVLSLWQSVKDGLKSGWDWIKANVVDPHIAAWNWLRDKFDDVKVKVLELWQNVKDGLKAGWDWVKTNVVNKFVDGFNWAKDKFEDVKTKVLDAWDLVKTGLKSTWDWIDTNVITKFKDAIGTLGDAFETAKDAIKTAWDKVKEVAAKPINFVIETVYMEGIKKTWDNIAEKVGLSLRLPTIEPIGGYAQGGVLPGYTPGRDVHQFYSPTGGRLDLSGGEAIMRPEFTRLVGGASGIDAINAMARAGQLPWESHWLGGVWDGVTSGVSNAWNWGADKVGQAWDWTKNAAESVANFISDPIAAIVDLIGKPVNALLGQVAPGISGDVVKALPGKFLNSLGDWAKGAVSGKSSSDHAPHLFPPPAAPGMGWKAMRDLVKARFPNVVMTSGNRPGAVTASGAPSYHGTGRAVDLTPSMQVFNWLSGTYPNSSELLYSPAGARQILRGGVRGDTSGITRANHWDHVHWAMNQGGVIPRIEYDTGGVLPPGDTLVTNRTGRPELILNSAQIAGLSRPDGPLDLSDESIDRLAEAIAEELADELGDTVREVRSTVKRSRILERL